MAMTHARAPQRKMSPAGLGPLTLPAQICQRYQEASGALLASKATQPRHSSAATASLAAPQEGMALVDPKGVPWYPLPAGFSAEIPQPSQTCGKSRRKPACGIFQHRDVGPAGRRMRPGRLPHRLRHRLHPHQRHHRVHLPLPQRRPAELQAVHQAVPLCWEQAGLCRGGPQAQQQVRQRRWFVRRPDIGPTNQISGGRTRFFP
jgi:hypothetical protein